MTKRPQETTDCPETHFQCLDNGYCLPVFLRCNGVYDCPGKEDEGGCGDYTCPDYYRCRGSTVCLHPFYVCDGNFQCPQKDDEQLCGMSCPEQCTCRGLAFFCNASFEGSGYPGVRYLDASGSGMTPAHLTSNRMLIHVDLSQCGLSSVGSLWLPNLISLDLSYNQLTDINTEQFQRCSHLRHLSVSNNPLKSLFTGHLSQSSSLDSLVSVDLSNVAMFVIDTSMFRAFTNIEILNLSFSGIHRVTGSGFQIMQNLRTIDLRGCPIVSYNVTLLKDLNTLHSLHVDNYKLCCPQVLPVGFNVNNCYGPEDIVSSCESLLGSSIYRASFAVLSMSVLLFDSITAAVWLLASRNKHRQILYVFLLHIAGCDLLMGVHTAIVTIADQVYRGQYVWKDTAWRHSVMCQVSGCVFFLSTEVSAFLTCLMTLERCAALRCPHRHIRVTTRATHVCCLAVWTGCVLLTAVSLIPHTPHQDLHTQTGVCQPLIDLLSESTNHDYTLGTLVVLPFLLALGTSAGQLCLSQTLRQQTDILLSLRTKRTESDQVTLSRRVSTLITFSALCTSWSCLSVGLASAGVTVSSKVQLGSSLLVMPLKSALGPAVYVVGRLKERQRLTQRKRLFQRLGVTQQL